MPFQVGGDKSILKVVGGEPITYTPGGLPTDPVVQAIPIPRGVLFEWDCQPTLIGPYYEYYFKVGILGTRYPLVGAFETHTNRAVWYLDEVEASVDVNSVIHLYVTARNAAGASSAEVHAQGISRSYDAGPGGIGSGNDFSDSSVDVTKLRTSATDRMFGTAARGLGDTTDSGGRFAAIEAGADKTSTKTSNDTSNVAGIAAATVRDNAADGKTAFDKLAAEVGVDTVETTLGSQAKIDLRLSPTERAFLSADKTLSGANDLFHTGRVPTLTQLGIPKVQNASPDEIRAGITKTNVVDTGVTLLDLGGVSEDSAPTGLKNSSISLTDTGLLLGAGGGEVTAEGLGLAAFKGKKFSDVHSDMTIADIQGTGLTIDHVPDGAAFSRVTKAERKIITAGRQVWSWFESTPANPYPTTISFSGVNTRQWLFEIIKLYGDATLNLRVWAAYNGANGTITLEVWACGGGAALLSDIYTMPNTGYVPHRLSVPITTLTNDTVYWCFVYFADTDGGAVDLSVRGGVAYIGY